MLTIVDYGMGNIGSILNMLKKIGVQGNISSDPSVVESANKLILPGVGAFDQGMSNLKERGLIEPLTRAVMEKKTKVIGICLGMQLFCKRSEEGTLPGLSWLDAEVIRFNFQGANNENQRLKIPHMGWNTVTVKKSLSVSEGITDETRFYFVHSYHLKCNNAGDELLSATYGYPFPAAIANENLFGVQFHPEKSHRFGMQLLKNFANW